SLTWKATYLGLKGSGFEEVIELLATARKRNGGESDRPLLSHHAIISAARKLISAEGHESLSLRKLSLDLGVTPPALYAHVESKEELLRAVAHSEFEWLAVMSAKIS